MTLLERFEEWYEKHGIFQGSAAVLKPLTFMHKLGVTNKSNRTAEGAITGRRSKSHCKIKANVPSSVGNSEVCEVRNLNMGFFSWVPSNPYSVSLD